MNKIKKGIKSAIFTFESYTQFFPWSKGDPERKENYTIGEIDNITELEEKGLIWLAELEKKNIIIKAKSREFNTKQIHPELMKMFFEHGVLSIVALYYNITENYTWGEPIYRTTIRRQ